jgi:hypothetical protein
MTSSDEEDLVYGFQKANTGEAVQDHAIKEHLVIVGLNYSCNGRTCQAHPSMIIRVVTVSAECVAERIISSISASISRYLGLGPLCSVLAERLADR